MFWSYYEVLVFVTQLETDQVASASFSFDHSNLALKSLMGHTLMHTRIDFHAYLVSELVGSEYPAQSQFTFFSGGLT